MNCRDIETLLQKEGDGVLTPGEQASLGAHLALCPACRVYREQLSVALNRYRDEAKLVALPDPDEEWAAIRGRLHSSPSARTPKRRLAPVIWFAAPLAAAAALALAYLERGGPVALPSASNGSAIEVARAEYVEAGNADASTMVYVDKESGWLVVWAADTTAKSG